MLNFTKQTETRAARTRVAVLLKNATEKRHAELRIAHELQQVNEAIDKLERIADDERNALRAELAERNLIPLRVERERLWKKSCNLELIHPEYV